MRTTLQLLLKLKIPADNNIFDILFREKRKLQFMFNTVYMQHFHIGCILSMFLNLWPLYHAKHSFHSNKKSASFVNFAFPPYVIAVLIEFFAGRFRMYPNDPLLAVTLNQWLAPRSQASIS